MDRIRVGFIEDNQFVFEADIRDFFGSIDHERLLSLVAERVSDRRVLRLLRQWLRAGVLVDGVLAETVTGAPQGGVISPLLANIYLHAFDRAWDEHGVGEIVRYADDFVMLCKTQAEAEEAQRRAAAVLGGGRLWEQRRVIRYYLHRWPSVRSMKRARARLKALTARSQVGKDLPEVIGAINRFLRGWGNYFRTDNASTRFRALDDYVFWRLRRLLVEKRGRNLRAGQVGRWTRHWFYDQGVCTSSMAPSDTRRRRNHV